MTRSLRRVLFLAITVLVSSAHIGSPDAWYDGPAGPYHVLVHVQAPPVVPGIATVNVKPNESVGRVTAFVNRFDATGGAPPPEVAPPVAGDPGWYRTRLWVMTQGSNSVTITVEGGLGQGTVVIPLTAVAGRRLEFNRPLAALLLVAGTVLALGLFTIVGAAVRESVLPPGVEPDVTHRRRARFAMARASIVFVLAMTGTAAWWRSEDADFARNLFQPLAITARVDTSAHPSRLTLTIDDPSWIQRNDVTRLRVRGETSRNELIDDHGKLLHLFLIATGRPTVFVHLHPATSDTITFVTTLPPLPVGSYRMFADIVHASGLTETMTSTISVTAQGTHTGDWRSDQDDSWSTGGEQGDAIHARLEDGSTLTWLRMGAPLVPNAEANLRFSLTPPPGDTAAIEPYLGMAGHAAVARDDGRVFIHLHPLGTISLAAQTSLTHSAVGMAMAKAMPAALGDTLYFPYAFPQSGRYTIWVQLKRRGRVLTGSFPAVVSGVTR